MTIKVDLGPRLEGVIAVAQGRYSSEDEVLRQAMLLFEENEERMDIPDPVLDAALEEGIADVEAGRTHTLEEVFDELEARARSRLAKP